MYLNVFLRFCTVLTDERTIVILRHSGTVLYLCHKTCNNNNRCGDARPSRRTAGQSPLWKVSGARGVGEAIAECCSHRGHSQTGHGLCHGTAETKASCRARCRDTSCSLSWRSLRLVVSPKTPRDVAEEGRRQRVVRTCKGAALIDSEVKRLVSHQTGS